MQAIKILTFRLFLLSLLLAGLIYLLEYLFGPIWIHDKIWLILSFFVVLTWLTGSFSHYLIGISKENSVNILLGATGIRLLASIGFVAIMLALKLENIIWFVVNFFIIYFFYLLFDIYGVMANLRPNSK